VTLRKLAFVAFTCCLTCSGEAPASRARVVVTSGHSYSPQPPVLTKDDLTVTQGSETLPITNLIPMRGERARLELFLLVDNCSNCEPGPKFQELRRFIGSQPSTTAVGVAYIRDGKLAVLESPTPDHQLAIRALSLPEGGKPSNPFSAFKELIEGWRGKASRRVVLMISNGIAPGEASESESASVESAIAAAQRAEVTLYAIYHPSADYQNTNYSRIDSGQVQLSHVAAETGGEAYFLGPAPLPSLAPFLADISEHLANQYLVEFLAQPGEEDLQAISIKCQRDLDLRAPYKVLVPKTK